MTKVLWIVVGSVTESSFDKVKCVLHYMSEHSDCQATTSVSRSRGALWGAPRCAYQIFTRISGAT